MSKNAYVPENGMRRHGGGLGRPPFFCVQKVPSEPSFSLKSSRYEIVSVLILRGQDGSESLGVVPGGPIKSVGGNVGGISVSV